MATLATPSSPLSSITFVPSRPASSRRPTETTIPERVVSSIVIEEAEQIEDETEQFKGDEPKDPPAKSLAQPPSDPTTDPNLVQWDGPDDPENPKNWSTRRKWMITVVVILMTVNVSFSSTAPAEVGSLLMEQFDISLEASYLVTTCFMMGYVFGPFFWGPGSELVGRRPIFIITMTSYSLFHLGQTLAPNIQTLLVTRFFGGFFGVAPMVGSGGVIADIFPIDRSGPAMSFFTAGVFLGPVIGPIVSGYMVVSGVSWRWVFWVMMMFAGSCTVIMVLLLPETFAPVLLLQKAKRLRRADPVANANLYAEHERQDWSFYGVIRRTLFRPFKMLSLEPILVFITIYTSIVYGLLYGLFEAVPVIFMERRGFNEGQDGLIFIGVGIGTTIGAFTNMYLTRNYKELKKKWKGFPPPENRLPSSMIAAPGFVIGIFWLGWTGQYAFIPWYVPALSMVLLGASISMIFMSFQSYMVDTYSIYSASAFSVNSVFRAVLAATFPLFIVQMLTKLGIGWACTLFGLVALLFVPCPFLFHKYGHKIREKSRFAPCHDLKVAKELEAEERKMTMNEKVADV